MSYLSVENLDEFKQAVISLWFKVPQKAIDKAKENYSDADPAPPLNGIVPLVVFGQEGKGDNKYKTTKNEHVYTGTSGSGTFYHGGLTDISAECTSTDGIAGSCCLTSLITFTYECTSHTSGGEAQYNGTTYTTVPDGEQPTTDPSFIGVDRDGKLVVNFESAKVPKTENYFTEVSSITPGQGGTGGIVGQCFGGTKSFGCDVLCCFCLIIECSNDADNGDGEDNTTPSPPPSGYTDPGYPPKENHTNTPGILDGTSAIRSDVIDVAADAWHHVLISVDLKPLASHGVASGESADGPIGDYIDSASQLFIALDDKNYIKDKLSDDWAEGKGDNDVVSDGAYEVAGEEAGEDEPIPKYTLEDSSVPAGPVGLPATTKYVNNIYGVQMAEFLMWTGKTLDTGVEGNRRHFITNVLKDGFQHPTNTQPLYIPFFKYAIGDPATWEPGADDPVYAPPLFDPSAWPTAIKGLGTADIDFTKCQFNWQMGRNIGTNDSHVTKTGKIKGLVPPKDESPKVQPGG